MRLELRSIVPWSAITAAVLTATGCADQPKIVTNWYAADGGVLISLERMTLVPQVDPNVLIVGEAGVDPRENWKLEVGQTPNGRPLLATVSVRPPRSNVEVFQLYQRNRFCHAAATSPACRSVLDAVNKGFAEYSDSVELNLALVGAITIRPGSQIRIASAGETFVVYDGKAAIGPNDGAAFSRSALRSEELAKFLRRSFVPRGSAIIVARSEVSFDESSRQVRIDFQQPRVAALADGGGDEQGSWLQAPKPFDVPAGRGRMDLRSKPKKAEIWLFDNLGVETDTELDLRRDVQNQLLYRKSGYDDCHYDEMRKTEVALPMRKTKAFCRLEKAQP